MNRPALTPEEWVRGEVHEGENRWGGTVYADADSLEFDDGIDPQHGASFRERRHAVGALALWGQPYGLTHAQVESTLRVLALAADTMVDAADYDAALALVENVRALLPPRELVPPQQPSDKQDQLG